MKLSWIDDMMTRDDVLMTKKSKILKLLKIVQKRLNMISKSILHHLAKFQISWPSFRVILGNLKKNWNKMRIFFGTRHESRENHVKNGTFTS